MIFLYAMALFAQGDKMNIGVTDLSGRGVDEASTAIISDRLRTALYKEGGLTVLERNAMKDVLKEQGFQQSGCTSDACAIEIGQLLGVNYMVVGTVGKLGRLYTIDVRMIQVSTGKIVYSENVDCDCPIEKVLTGSIVSIAQKISRHVKSPDTGAKAGIATGSGSGKSSVNSARAAGQKQDASAAVGEKKPRKVPVLTISLGAAAVAAGVLGVVFDSRMKSELDANSELKSTYLASIGDARYAEYLSMLKANADQARENQTRRNICYILSGLSLAGFAISFAF
jgi:TolB-like protein